MARHPEAAPLPAPGPRESKQRNLRNVNRSASLRPNLRDTLLQANGRPQWSPSISYAQEVT